MDNVKKLDFVWISQKMKLIDKNDDWKMSVYFAREITTDTGETLTESRCGSGTGNC